MQHRSLPKPFDLSIHFPSKHKPKHLQITQNRPKGVSKSRREIPLNKQVTIHSTSITKERNKEQEPPAEENRTEQEENAEECLQSAISLLMASSDDSCNTPRNLLSFWNSWLNQHKPSLELKLKLWCGSEFQEIWLKQFLGMVEIACWESWWCKETVGLSMRVGFVRSGSKNVKGGFKLQSVVSCFWYFV